MPRPLAIALTLLSAACAAKGPRSLTEVVESLDFAETPRLPSPEAGTYVVGPAPSRDPVIAPMLAGKMHDGALAAAAAGLALSATAGQGTITRWELRESLWRGGFPHPVVDARAWTLGAQGVPPRDLVAWVEAASTDEPMSLVRARGRDGDVWVGLRARPAFDLGGVPRVAALGSVLVLPAVAGATWQVADHEGDLRGGSLDDGARVLLAAAGEWLVDIRQDRKELARFPMYVGVRPPATPLLRMDPPPDPVATARDADALAVRLLAHVRDAYGVPAWRRSPVLDTVAARYAEDPTPGSAALLAGLGFDGVASIAWACDEATVEDCMDAWVWDVRRRRTLLTEQMDSFGLHATLDGRGVHLTLLLVDAE